MACRLTGASHYLNQCWIIVNWTLRNKLQWNLNPNSNVFIQENAFESVVCETVAILSWPQCVKYIFWWRIHIHNYIYVIWIKLYIYIEIKYYIYATWINLCIYIEMKSKRIYTCNLSHEICAFLCLILSSMDSSMDSSKLYPDLVQDCGISIANALEIRQSCTKPSIYPCSLRVSDWHLENHIEKSQGEIIFLKVWEKSGNFVKSQGVFTF